MTKMRRRRCRRRGFKNNDTAETSRGLDWKEVEITVDRVLRARRPMVKRNKDRSGVLKPNVLNKCEAWPLAGDSFEQFVP